MLSKRTTRLEAREPLCLIWEETNKSWTSIISLLSWEIQGHKI